MRWPLAELRARGLYDANPVLAEVENDLLLQHPGGSKDGVCPWPVVLEGVAPRCRRPLPVHVGAWNPRGLQSVEDDLDGGESPEARMVLRNVPAGAPTPCATAAVPSAEVLDGPAQRSIKVAGHVNVSRPTVDHRAAEARANVLAIHPHCGERDPVVACRGGERDVCNFAGVVGRVVAANHHAATPLSQAECKDVAIDVCAVGKHLL
mmetsp:Transcript_123070/g.342775  ORF Transcript_123070/g.342775 Transcript_123070/m.342775 type:complete len:207 (+) Transcript_123070:602-1222(+)